MFHWFMAFLNSLLKKGKFFPFTYFVFNGAWWLITDIRRLFCAQWMSSMSSNISLTWKGTDSICSRNDSSLKRFMLRYVIFLVGISGAYILDATAIRLWKSLQPKSILTLPEKHFGLFVIKTSTREDVSDLKHVAPVTRLVNPKISHVSDSTFGPRRLQFMSPKTRRCCHLLGNIYITLTWNQKKLHH